MRVLHQDLVVGQLAEDQEAAIGTLGDGGKRDFGELRPVTGNGAGLEAEILGATQHLGDAGRDAAQAMTNLPGIGGNTVKAQQQHQTGQPAVLAVSPGGSGIARSARVRNIHTLVRPECPARFARAPRRKGSQG